MNEHLKIRDIAHSKNETGKQIDLCIMFDQDRLTDLMEETDFPTACWQAAVILRALTATKELKNTFAGLLADLCPPPITRANSSPIAGNRGEGRGTETRIACYPDYIPANRQELSFNYAPSKDVRADRFALASKDRLEVS